MKRDRHAMISRAGGNHAAAGIFGREGQESVQRAPLFERTGQLQVFELEKYLTAGHSADRFRVSERREIDLLLDALAGFFDIDEGNHGQCQS